MADEHDVHFESADAGASLTFPQQAGTIRKNGFIVIKGRPCKVPPDGCRVPTGLLLILHVGRDARCSAAEACALQLPAEPI